MYSMLAQMPPLASTGAAVPVRYLPSSLRLRPHHAAPTSALTWHPRAQHSHTAAHSSPFRRGSVQFCRCSVAGSPLFRAVPSARSTALSCLELRSSHLHTLLAPLPASHPSVNIQNSNLKCSKHERESVGDTVLISTQYQHFPFLKLVRSLARFTLAAPFGAPTFVRSPCC